MLARLAVSGAVALAFALSTVLLWQFLKEDETRDFARLAETESYAARSRLVRDLETQLRALREIARYWDIYGRQPKDQWNMDAQIDLASFVGVEHIIWNDATADIRYATTPGRMLLDNRPVEAEWRILSELLAGVDSSAGETLLGPTVNDRGQAEYRVVIPSRRGRRAGVLVALVNADVLLSNLLMDRSPGYSIAVEWDGVTLYRRGEPARDIQPEWVRDGLIELSMGPLWRVEHAPMDALAATAHRQALDLLLVAGLVIAGLAGFLVIQNARVRDRAMAAERAERGLAELNRDLELQVAERTSELAQQTVDLETISESVSHDLRTPLNTVGLNVQLLRETMSRGDPAMVDTAIDRIDHARQRMTGILDRLRAFTQVSFAVFERQRVDMAVLVREVFDELGYGEPGPPAELRLGDLQPCLADPTLVRILLLNLLSNALKYTRTRASRWVEVGCEAGPGPTTYFVRDNGIGFDSADAETLFEPFRRVGRNSAVDGQGVGLAIAMRVVHRHGGRIRAEGVPDGGAEFRFDLGDRSVLRE